MISQDIWGGWSLVLWPLSILLLCHSQCIKSVSLRLIGWPLHTVESISSRKQGEGRQWSILFVHLIPFQEEKSFSGAPSDFSSGLIDQSSFPLLDYSWTKWKELPWVVRSIMTHPWDMGKLNSLVSKKDGENDNFHHLSPTGLSIYMFIPISQLIPPAPFPPCYSYVCSAHVHLIFLLCR